MAQFPNPIEHFGSTSIKVEVSGQYAKVRYRLRDLADELAESNANVVLAVLDQYIPQIWNRVERLENDQGVNGNYAYHLGQMEEHEIYKRLNKYMRATLQDRKDLTAEKLRLGGVIAKH